MKLYLPIFLSFITSVVFSQETRISGKVVDEGNVPLLGANVLLNNNNGTTTNENGNYSIENVPDGEYNITVTFLGYQQQTRKVRITGQDMVRVDFVLAQASEQLQEVEITGRRERSYKNDVTFAATKTATPIKDIPQAISYVTKEVFNDQLA